MMEAQSVTKSLSLSLSPDFVLKIKYCQAYWRYLWLKSGITICFHKLVARSYWSIAYETNEKAYWLNTVLSLSNILYLTANALILLNCPYKHEN